MTRKARAAVASSPDVEAAAEEVLRKGNAIDAVVAGVFAAAALSPGVLLGPVQLLFGGGGAGLRAIDGRVRQPGIGAPRPRGFVSATEIPEGARVGATWFPATLSAALATSGTSTFSAVMAPALALAKGSARAEILAKIAARGPRAIEERPLASELLAVAGRANGGLLTADDLASPRPEVLPARRTEVLGKPLALLPWANVEDGLPVPPAAEVEVGRARAVLAVDRNGMFAIGVWEEATEGVFLEELGLRAPPFAEPVRRGQTRTRPGDPRPAAAPVLLMGGAGGPEIGFAAFGAGDAYAVLGEAVRRLATDERIEAHGEARLAAIAHRDGAASVFRS